MRHGRLQSAPDSMTRTAARTQMAMLLHGATDTALAAFSPEFLVATHKVTLAEAVQALKDARRTRWHD